VNRRVVLFVFLFAAIHLALTAYALVGSLYFTFPGEPEFDPMAAERAATFATVLHALAFPVLPLVISSPFPRAISAGLLGWLWLGLNSLLWAAAIALIAQFLARRARTTTRGS